MKIYIEIQIEVEAECTYHRGSVDRFDTSHGNWLPGDPEGIDNLKVFINKSNQRIEITDALTSSTKNDIEEQILEIARNDEECA